MKKIVIAFGILLITTLVIVSIPKNAPEKTMVKEQPTIEETGSSTDMAQPNSVRYIDYTQPSFDQMSNKKRVYFFHAKWCPTCKAANEEFMENSDRIPSDVILFKTDYDIEKELKTKYGITYQHTFVYVDGSGNEIKKWNGGGITELMNNTK